MKLFALGLAFAVSAAACGATLDEPHHAVLGDPTERVHDGGHVKLWIPPGWAVDQENTDTLVMSAPDQTVSLEVTLLDAKDLAGALAGVTLAALIDYDHLELVGAPQSGDVNGMNALFQAGHATYKGNPVELSVGVLDTPAQKYLLVLGEASSDAFAEHESTIREVMHRIHPI